MSWHVYLLICADGALYCGVTTDVTRRLAEHNAGTASRCTRARLPVRLAACAPCADKSEALRLEIAVKKRPRAAKLSFLLGHPGASCPGAVCPDADPPESACPASPCPDSLSPDSPYSGARLPVTSPEACCAEGGAADSACLDSTGLAAAAAHAEPPASVPAASVNTASLRLASASQPAPTPELS